MPIDTSDRRPLPRAILLAPTDAALAIARRLGPRGVPVTFLAEEPSRWVTRTRWGKGVAVGQLPGDTDGWLARLAELGREPGVLIPGTDRTSEFIARNRARIPEGLRSFEAADGAHLELIDKGELYRVAGDLGIRCPWTLRLPGRDELPSVAERARFPCLVKPAVSHHWRRLFGEHRVLEVADRAELERVAGPALDAGLELLVSEHVPGPDRAIETAAVLRRADGSIALRYGKRKLRQYPPGFGVGSLHESVPARGTMAMAERLLDAAGFAGIAHLEAKRDPDTGEPVLIEVNVRVTQSFGIGDAAGTDASWRLYATLAGIELPEQPPQLDGVRMIVPSIEPRAVVSNLAERRLTAREVLASYRGVRDLSGLSWRDPAPAVALAARLLRPLARRLRSNRGKRWT